MPQMTGNENQQVQTSSAAGSSPTDAEHQTLWPGVPGMHQLVSSVLVAMVTPQISQPLAARSQLETQRTETVQHCHRNTQRTETVQHCHRNTQCTETVQHCHRNTQKTESFHKQKKQAMQPVRLFIKLSSSSSSSAISVLNKSNSRNQTW